jgi:hypothetical protein
MAKSMLRLGAWLGESEVVLVPCTVTTISDVLREHEITCVDYLKIDVEGAELDVLRGVALEDWASIKRLGVEVHDVNGRLAQVGELLEAAGFDHVEIEQGWPFEGTNVYMLHARRTSPPAGSPSSSRIVAR